MTLDELIEALSTARGEQDLRALHAQGQREVLAALKAAIGTVPPAQRRDEGRKFNEAQARVKAAFDGRLAELEGQAAGADLQRRVDVSLPGRGFPPGQQHILSQVQEEMVAIFAELGFELAEGPQVETDFNNFEALAMPKDHPARDMQDTFYVSDDVVLRTHTSPVQIRTMLSQPPPVKIIAPGVVYRRDDDLTHSPMFTQIEGLLVDEQVRFSDLKGVLVHFVSRFFGKALDIRLRPSYFPFVEPGAEIDMQCAFCAGPGAGCRVCKSTGWVEIGGSGMVDPRVFAHVGYDSEKYTGFAFGTGVERMAMLRHGINDIKFYYEGDLRFLRQF
ncbi:MAG TPA: phenylalanine--tRNA ligase subunit alpha [Kofleriaceae bacterium]|nr:phenylalanine--tRNA ligase subunit alpha [Kofleriaceae bacterium]